MRVLVIGGTGFVGSAVVRRLVAESHRVAVVHRGYTKAQEAVVAIRATRMDLPAVIRDVEAFAPDVVIDTILSSRRQARIALDVLSGRTGRIVALSSADVYRAYAVLHRLDAGPLQPVPLTEASDLRSVHETYSPEALRRVQQVFPWVDADHDKVAVERELVTNSHLPATILRLPMVYGPGDPLHRLAPVLRRMESSPTEFFLEEKLARWRAARGYVDNVASAIVVAATAPAAAGRIYNVAEPDCCSELEWAQQVATVMGWKGRVTTLPFDEAPQDARAPGNLDQHWMVDSTRIRNELGYAEHITRSEALCRAVEWERAHPSSMS